MNGGPDGGRRGTVAPVRPAGPRVVSLVPSLTETLLAWGVDVVACTRFCEQPGLRHVGGTKDPDVAAITVLAPDLVVMDAEENRRQDHETLVGAGLRVHATAVRALGDVEPALAGLADALGIAFGGLGIEPGADPVRLRVFVPIWRRPWMTVNGSTYASTLLAAAGIANVFADHADRYPIVDLDDVTGRDPQAVLAPSEPYPFGPRHIPELQEIAPDVTLVDGRDVTWWGVRTPAALGRIRRWSTG